MNRHAVITWEPPTLASVASLGRFDRTRASGRADGRPAEVDSSTT